MQSNQQGRRNVGSESKRVEQYGQTYNQDIQSAQSENSGLGKLQGQNFQSTAQQLADQNRHFGQSMGKGEKLRDDTAGQQALGQLTNQNKNLQGNLQGHQQGVDRNPNM